ncbi:MAG: quinohemoprotein ethanol dehydrogenase [Myxococcota bacterium]|jgi:quinohemoprotein ethanol dehydrogenase
MLPRLGPQTLRLTNQRLGRTRALVCIAVIETIALVTSGAPAIAEDSTEPGKQVAGWVDAARVESPEQNADNWLVHGRTNDEARHSPLADINTANIDQLGLAWSYAVGSKRGLEATPIVVDGVMYATGTWSTVFALDAKTGRELWRFDPAVPRWKGRDACCDVVNRGVAVWKGRVYVGTIDGRLIALDAATGESIWQVQTTDPKMQYTITGAPRVVKDLVVIGNGGADLGVRGYFTAYDVATGEQRWRFYTVPSSKEGPHEHKELIEAAKTWPTNALWEAGGGGTVWDSMAYDAALDLLYVGTGNSSVYHQEHRSPGGGDNLFVSSILAVRPDTGELVWHYQTTPGESWDYTATQQIILADRIWKGKPRKLLLQAPKNGFFYVLDRVTGELLGAEKFVDVSWATHVDLATGRPVQRDEANWNDETRVISPHPMGAHSWHPMSYDAAKGLVFLPTFELANAYAPDPDFVYRRGAYNNSGEDWAEMSRMSEVMAPMKNSICEPSRLVAWDVDAQAKKWEVIQDRVTAAGVLSTAGDLVFQGDVTGDLVAYDAETGKRLWSAPTGVSIMAAPVTYRVDGEQYVAVLAGLGGVVGLAFADLKTENKGQVFAFKLDGKAKFPAVLKRPAGSVAVEPIDTSRAALDRGRGLYGEHCIRCHGPGAISTGLMPDLRHASAKVHASWDDIVLGATRAKDGMASFADLLTAEESQAIHAWVVERATHDPTVVDHMVRWLADSPFCVRSRWITD